MIISRCRDNYVITGNFIYRVAVEDIVQEQDDFSAILFLFINPRLLQGIHIRIQKSVFLLHSNGHASYKDYLVDNS